MRQGGSYVEAADGTERLVQRTKPHPEIAGAIAPATPRPLRTRATPKPATAPAAPPPPAPPPPPVTAPAEEHA